MRRPNFTMDFKKILSDGATLAPEILLTPDGPKRDFVVQFGAGRITGVGPLGSFPTHFHYLAELLSLVSLMHILTSDKFLGRL